MPDVLPQSFVDLLRLWRVDPTGTSDLLLAAAGSLRIDRASGPLGEALADLLRDGESSSRAGFAQLVSAVEAAADLTPLTGTEAQDAAVAVSAGRVLAGEITPRELTYWVTRVVGLRGGVRTQVFLDLEQDYCARLGDSDVTDIDASVLEAATGFVAGFVAEPVDDAPAAGHKRGLRGLFTRRRS